MLPDIEIARQTQLLPIAEVAARLGIGPEHLEYYGLAKAKIAQEFCQSLENAPASGKLILVSGINPTPAGEGKTTTTIGLGDALNRIGKRATICLREPSLGPCFGMKGGATGGGYAQVAPMEDINLHFTGDIHAVTTAHNLLAAALDNHLHHGNTRCIDPHRLVWNRVLDMNDRALRKVSIGVGDTARSFPRQSGFDITVASEVMAILCLSESPDDLKARLSRIVVGQTHSGQSVCASDLAVHGAMAVLLYLRYRFTWWNLHPIGFPVASTFQITYYLWFNIFLAWLIKGAVLRYGGVGLYRSLRPFFLGLVLGEFTTACAWVFIDGHFGFEGNMIYNF